MVDVTGTGFKANASITITYTNSGSSAVTVGTAKADALGNWSGWFVVPATAGIPSTNTVTASAAGGGSATTTHKLPGAWITTDVRERSAGQLLTITGNGFPSYTPIAILTIGGLDVRPNPAPSTDSDGYFKTGVIVPDLVGGSHKISVTSGSVTAAAAITIPPAVLGEANNISSC